MCSRYIASKNNGTIKMVKEKHKGDNKHQLYQILRNHYIKKISEICERTICQIHQKAHLQVFLYRLSQVT